MIKVLVVDDSVFMRKLLSDLFAGEADFSVVDTARNGKDALDKVKRLKPDVITLDVEMPVVDGLQALELIMAECPTPVVMISSLTQTGALRSMSRTFSISCVSSAIVVNPMVADIPLMV